MPSFLPASLTWYCGQSLQVILQTMLVCSFAVISSFGELTLCAVSGWVHVLFRRRGVHLCVPFLLRYLACMALGAICISCL